MHIRLANIDDLAAIMDLYHEVSDAMVGTPHDCCWRREGHPTPEFVAELVESDGMLVAAEDDVIFAVVGVDHDLGHDYGNLRWLVDVPDELVAVIHLLAVREAWRGAGISRELLRACLDEARTRGMRTARLDATANNAPAIALYQSEGFQQVGADDVYVGLPDEPIVPFVVMELPL